MTPSTELDLVHHWCEEAARAASSKKATDIVIFDVGRILAITDSFVIASGANDRQVRTIVEEVERGLKQEGGPSPLRLEGVREAQWVLMDYGDFVVHVFRSDVREFYDLERLWSDAPRHEWDERPIAAIAE
jgi:ribosome-associated protein